MTAGLGLPTGARAIAGPGPQPYLQFPWSVELGGGWGISGMVTNFFVPTSMVSRYSNQSTFVIEREFGEPPSYSPNMSAISRSKAVPGSCSIPAAATGSRIPSSVDFHVGIGLNRVAPAYIFGIGYSFRLDKR